MIPLPNDLFLADFVALTCVLPEMRLLGLLPC